MKKVLAIVLLVFTAFLGTAWGQVMVPGYERHRPNDLFGPTYPVPSHLRSVPNDTILDNYGFPGNYNPNRGRFTPGDPGRGLERELFRDLYKTPRIPRTWRP